MPEFIEDDPRLELLAPPGQVWCRGHQCFHPREEFERSRRFGNRTGFAESCRTYGVELARTRRRRWKEKHPESVHAWEQRNAEREHARQLRRKYDLTKEEYEKRLVAQNGVCYACGKTESAVSPRTGNVKRLAVDHNHRTGEVCSLLCSACNVTIGLCGYSPDRLRALADYCEEFHGTSR